MSEKASTTVRFQPEIGIRRYPPIADYALIGDCQSAALVSVDGSIDWCCFQRFDARPVFARQLDWEQGGHFRIAPAGPYAATRAYRPSTNVLETRFETDTGVLIVVDCFAIEGTRDNTPPSRTSGHVSSRLLRLLRCEHGHVSIRVDFRPRFDFGLTIPRLEMRSAELGVVYGGADGLVLQSDISMIQVEICRARAEVDLSAGDEGFFALTYSLPHELHAELVDRARADACVDATAQYWRDWSATCKYEGPYREEVLRSALVLKALTYAPTGAIVAAPTTSLPEELGGRRNWDYRYSWLRDAALNLYALFALGHTEEANAFMAWIERTTAGRAQDLQIMYGIGGERLLPEVELDTLDGFRGSRPVRIGNGAVKQFQLDVYGYLLDTAWLYHRAGGDISPSFWSFLEGVVKVVAERWRLPDEGIWEVRAEPRHFVSSKILAWVAVDRAIRLAQARTLPAEIDGWQSLRAEIRQCIEAEGVDRRTGALVQAFGSDTLDASNLLASLVGFLPADDARIRATIRRTADELATNGFVYRYRDYNDGIAGTEATFVICSFWLVDNLARSGETRPARELFERLLGCSNDVGLLSEEIDTGTGELLGNFPQAFSHVGLISSAINLAKATRREENFTTLEE